MIEATCAACGNVNRIAESDLPLGAKSVTCASCKARVMLPAKPIAGAVGKPTPKAAAIPAIPKSIPGPKKAQADLADLPTPKRAGPLAGFEGSKPAPRSGLDVADLPAPKSKTPSSALDLDELVLSDLPGPKTKGPVDNLPTPKASGPLPPKGKGSAEPDITDLLAPKGPGSLSNLPAPKGKFPSKPAAQAAVAKPSDLDRLDGLGDLPAPKGGIDDLPAPKPGTSLDLPAPKGFFDDLPQPAARSKQQSSIDLPAPKGFFDDLPQPARAGKPDLVAPKGFFDDLPQPAKASAPLPPAPKGFFDDPPPPARPNKPTDRPAGKSTNVFDDLPDPSAPGEPQELSSADLFAAGGNDLDLGTTTHRGHEPLDLEPELGGVPELDLGFAAPPPSTTATTKSDFGDLDLSAPTAPPPPAASAKSGINIKSTSPSARATASSSASNAAFTSPKGGELKLDLEDEPDRANAQAVTTNAAKRALVKKTTDAAEASADVKARKAKRRRMVLTTMLGIVAAGAGGGYFYKRHHDAQLRNAEIQEHLQASQAAIHQATRGHWTRAANEATEVLALDEHNVRAMGLRAEALLGGVLDTGVGGDLKIAQGRRVLADALDAGITGPQLDAAQALGMIATNQADRAVAKLQTMVARDPKNGFWQLYLGWALLAKGDPAGAVKAFDAAAAADPTVKLPALYARGRAKLQLVDLDGAKADFAAVLDGQKDHIGAQVGLAAALPAAQSSQRETDLLAILARKDLAGGDPRSVVQAWTLAADVARSGGRLDVARERYEKALALSKTDVPALVGLAHVEIADNKLDVAADLVTRALAQAPDGADAQLVAADLELHQGKTGDALAIEQKLAARQPPLPPLQRASLLLLFGNILDSQGKDDDAITAWTDGAALAGDLDLSPMMAAVTKLGTLAKKAADNHDDNRAAGYRAKADQLLSSLADRAKDDPQLAKTLGAAYLGAGDPTKAEAFLRRAVEMRGTDIDAHLALAKALVKLGRTNDALEQLAAAQALDATRIDIALEIARTLEDAHRDADAAAAYAKLLAAKDVTIQARIHGGRFLARTGDIKNAAAQATPILAVEPDNPAGHYLKGEGLIVAGKLDDARKELTQAVDGDPDPQYLDAQGRAAEATVAAGGDTKYNDLALRAYERAIAVAPEMFNPQAGTGRIYVARKEWTKAINPLLAASKIDPNSAEVMFNIGITYKNLGQSPTAMKWLIAASQTKKDAATYWELGQLYQDANSGETARALHEATHLGAEQEKAGAKLEWLTEAYYRLGEVEALAHNAPAARDAYQHFVDRNPPPGAQLSEARRLLSTELR